jgi:hypothetical protein
MGAMAERLPSSTLGLRWLGALIIFAAGAFTTFLRVIAGTIGIGLAILVFVVLGNPSAGGAYAPPPLPAFWRVIGPWLPTGAGTSAVRAVAYFDGVNSTSNALVIAGYAAAGLVLTYVVLALIGRQLVHMPLGASRELADAGR